MKCNTKQARISCGRMAFFPCKENTEEYDTVNKCIIENIVKVSIKIETASETCYGSGKALIVTNKVLGSEIEIETYYLPLELRYILNGVKTEYNGTYQEKTSDNPIYFGLALESSVFSDGNKEWCYFGKCMLSPSDMETETSEDKIKFQADSYTIKSIPTSDDIVRFIVSETDIKEYIKKEDKEKLLNSKITIENFNKLDMVDNIFLSFEDITKKMEEM